MIESSALNIWLAFAFVFGFGVLVGRMAVPQCEAMLLRKRCVYLEEMNSRQESELEYVWGLLHAQDKESER